MLQIPRQAISCFEQLTATSLVLYDLCGDFRTALGIDYWLHREPCCHRVKRATSVQLCREFDETFLRNSSLNIRNGGLKLCHAGFVEWILPVWAEESMICILCAGMRRVPRDWHSPLPLIHGEYNMHADAPELPILTDDEARLVMEALHQLGARLRHWQQSLGGNEPMHGEPSREAVIRSIISTRFLGKLTLGDMSKIFHLSESRTAHMIKEATGKSFRTLLAEQRLRSVCIRLRTTGAPINEIARLSGFSDLSGFYRLFRETYQLSPHQFRQLSEDQAQKWQIANPNIFST